MRLPSIPFLGRGADSAGNGDSPARTRIRTILIVFLTADALLLFLVWRAPGASPVQRQQELDRKFAERKEVLNRLQQLRDLRTKMQAAIQNNQEFSRDHFLQRKSAFSAMLADLEETATKNHVKTSNITYQLVKDDKRPEFQNVTVTMAIQGQYADLLQFINRLEKSELFWIIDSMSVAPSTGRDLRLLLQMGTYSVTS